MVTRGEGRNGCQWAPGTLVWLTARVKEWNYAALASSCSSVKGGVENMKRLMVTATLLLLCILLPTALEGRGVKRYLKKESTVDMKNMNHIFLGWVGFSPDAWMFYRHKTAFFLSTGDPFTKEEWTDAISSL